MLFSTGYIAGGSIAGVIVTFLALSDTLPNTLAVWQYRTMPVAAAASFDAQCRALAEEELGASASPKQFERMAAEIRDLNEAKLRLYVRVPKGMMLNLPENQRYEAPADAALIEVAEQALGSGDKASLLFDLNENRLKLPEGLPSGVLLKIPQRNAPALIAFALLAALLAAVGVGWIMKPSENPV
jgi:acyl-CoA reductase-like NAD-dependent aldehyde dehydrogenase